jgi:hypothetical protein
LLSDARRAINKTISGIIRADENCVISISC